MPTGIQLIRAERRSQITKEKWTAKHDDAHTDFSLSAAARCYERCAKFQIRCGQIPVGLREAFNVEPREWPWESRWFKMGRTALRTLVKAGALYQAEIDRIERLLSRGATSQQDCEGCLKGAKNGVARTAGAIDGLLA